MNPMPYINKIPYQWLVFSTAAFSIFITATDRSAINIILPEISEEFSSALPTTQWVTIIYFLTVVSISVPMGRLSDIVGSKKVLVTGLLIFAIGALISTWAPSLNYLIFSRFIQGIGGGMIQGTSFIIAVSAFNETQKGKAIGLNLIFVSFGNLIGPLIGGLMADFIDWRSLFILFSGLAFTSGLLSTILLSKSSSKAKMSSDFDWIGSGLFISAFAFLLSGITFASRIGLSSLTTITLIVVAIILITLFIIKAINTKNPVLNISLFKIPLFSLSVISILTAFLAMSSVPFLLPFYLKYVLLFSTKRIGTALVPGGILMGIVSPISGLLSDKFGTRWFTFAGLLWTSIGLFILSTLNAESNEWLPYIGVIPVMSGVGGFYGPSNSAVLSVVPQSQSGSVIGLLNLTRNLGNLLAVPLSVLIVTTVMESNGFYPDLSSVTTSSDPQLLNAFILGMDRTFLYIGLLCVLGSILSLYRRSLKVK
jgi:EmrB/QacA subfamily drug resistance transporter